jgi:uncharacterized protein YndB with AHSA1/START domain
MNHIIKPAAIHKVLTVRGTPQRAFEVFTGGIDRWWPKQHHIGKSPLKKAVIEPSVGGRWYGLHEDGTESLWGDVLNWEPPHRVVLAWRITSDWVYDPTLLTTVEARFIALEGSETRVEFEHRELERLGDSESARRTRDSMDTGWLKILESFKEVVEE